jgi:cell division control protein 45
MTHDERDLHASRLEKYYMSGTWHGQSASSTMYILATALERVDNELLWLVVRSMLPTIELTRNYSRLAILGVTHQYITSRIPRSAYDKYHSIYYDEVFRLNPPNPATSTNTSIHPDDLSVRATEELRFMLFRHWTLYDAMYHSSYVAGRLGIWKERGRKRLTGLLAKMGYAWST